MIADGERRARVRRGSMLRTVALLLCPGWDLLADRFQAVELLRAAGIPDTVYGVQDVNPAVADEVPVLVHRDGRWTVGLWERGSFSGRAYGSEAEAARTFVQDVVTSTVVSMGGAGIDPHIKPRYDDAVRRALDEVGSWRPG
ncbi:hypothetical protein [Spirillospora sp. NPDC047279]|uniref:hypothetical protein n=1 Tax=Spirillospora sp. NPDC047279 TaxID=3155478 RepID=UPI00340860C6